jgi:hypothetical protein
MSQQFRPVQTLTVIAAGALPANRFVTFGGALPSANGNAFGVANSQAVNAGDKVPVITLGTALVTAGGAITAGSVVATDANGQAVTWSTGAKVGIALDAATASGQLIEVLLLPNA